MNIKQVLLTLSILISLQTIAASSNIIVHVDETGTCLFFGDTHKNIPLPEGITINEGKIRGETQECTVKQGSLWSFSLHIPESEMNIFLPQGSSVQSIDNGELYLKNNLVGKDQLVVYAVNNTTITYEIRDDKKNSLIAILIVALILFVIGFYAYKKSAKIPAEPSSSSSPSLSKQPTRDQRLSIIKKVLHPREKEILGMLKKTGKVKSSYLRKLCNIPKASFSRHIQELEKKHLIQRTGDGKNKFISLR